MREEACSAAGRVSLAQRLFGAVQTAWSHAEHRTRGQSKLRARTRRLSSTEAVRMSWLCAAFDTLEPTIQSRPSFSIGNARITVPAKLHPSLHSEIGRATQAGIPMYTPFRPGKATVGHTHNIAPARLSVCARVHSGLTGSCTSLRACCPQLNPHAPTARRRPLREQRGI